MESNSGANTGNQAVDAAVMDLQPPPYTCMVEHPVYSNAAAVLVTDTGREARGKLLAFDTRNELVTLAPETAGASTTHELSSIRSLRLPGCYKVADPPSETSHHLKFLNLAENQRNFVVHFANGEKVEGQTLGSRMDRNGLHFYPVTESGRCDHVFFSKTGIHHYEIGEKIGSLLVSEQSISARDLSSALDDMDKSRTTRIGEYLVNHQVLNSEDLEISLQRQKSIPHLKLGEILMADNLISSSQLEYALKEQKRNIKKPLGEILIAKGLLKRDQLQRSLARKLGIPFVNLQEFVVDPDILKSVQAILAYKFRVIPLSEYEGKLVVALENPLDWQAIESFRFALGRSVDAVMASHDDINWALQFYYSNEDISAEDTVLEELDADRDTAFDMHEFGKAETADVAENIVVRVVNKIIIDAHTQGASDIHIEPGTGEEKVLVRFRKDGTLSNYYKFPAKYRSAIVSRIKVMANLDISVRYKPQDGKILFRNFADLNIELRIATLPTAGNVEDVVMRLLSSGRALPINGIGLSTSSLDSILDLTSRPHGLFLVCGPTGSGKTTTLHAILSNLNTSERKIWTAEDPVEITQHGLRQVPINNKLGINFPDVMRAFMRADPDVMMIGEIRDKETADTAIEASLTGHMVLSTLHTNSAAETVVRLLEMGMNEFNFADSMKGVLSQRLVKTLCPSCKTHYLPAKEELDMLATEYLRDDVSKGGVEQKEKLLISWRDMYFNDRDITLFKPVGCQECLNTGYRGRLGVYELLQNSPEIKHLILTRATTPEILGMAVSQGMVTVRQDGIVKILRGLTDYAQVRTL